MRSLPETRKNAEKWQFMMMRGPSRHLFPSSPAVRLVLAGTAGQKMRRQPARSALLGTTTTAALALLALALPCARAGVGGSFLSLAPCAPASRVFQNWSYTAQQLQIAGDANPLWGSAWCMATGNGINALPAAPGARLYTSPCRAGLRLALSAGAPRSALQVADAAGAGLCVEVAGAPLAGAGLRLAPCAAPLSDAQAFASSGAGALTHAASGLCVDSGSRFRGCAAGSSAAGLPFCDAGAPLPARVADLVARLSFEEKVGMLATPSGGSASLGVSPQQWWQESLHGLAGNVGVAFDAPTPYATSFPQPILSSCSFNRSLWLATGQAISDEVRAFTNAGHSGLTLWAPNIVRAGPAPAPGRTFGC